MPSHLPIAIDFSTLDHLKMTAGHYRYTVDLVRGLAALAGSQKFLLFGSRPEPAPELRDLFHPGSAWVYRRMTHWKHRGSRVVDELAYLRHFLRTPISLLHVVHDYVPLVARCPVVVTKHDLIEEILPEYRATRAGKSYRWHRAQVEDRVARVICISQTTQKDLLRFWQVAPERTVVIPHGVGEEFFAEPGNDLLRDDDPLYGSGRPILVSQFNLEPRKNLSALLSAVKVLRADFPQLKLVLFGRGLVTPERERRFAELVEELELGEAIARLGVISDERLRQLYRRADIFVFPSLYEGFGLPLLEALACGACVLASATPALTEVAGGAAALADHVSDPAELARALAELLRDPARQRALRAAGPRRAREFPLERMVRRTWETYQDVLSAGRERGARQLMKGRR
ncbi:MAG: glycosyltransferase family 4 protein [Chthoniobacterales bacterium]